MSDKKNATKPQPIRLYRCPGCGKMTRYDKANPVRPFCSALCKNSDIVNWADQGYRIPGEPVNEHDLLAATNDDEQPLS